MSFAEQVARDAQFFCGNADAPFIKTINLWLDDADPAEDDPLEVNGRAHYAKEEYREGDRGTYLYEAVTCMVSVDQVESAPNVGVLEVDSAKYRIRHARNNGGCWAIYAEGMDRRTHGQREARLPR